MLRNEFGFLTTLMLRNELTFLFIHKKSKCKDKLKFILRKEFDFLTFFKFILCKEFDFLTFFKFILC